MVRSNAFPEKYLASYNIYKNKEGDYTSPLNGMKNLDAYQSIEKTAQHKTFAMRWSWRKSPQA